MNLHRRHEQLGQALREAGYPVTFKADATKLGIKLTSDITEQVAEYVAACERLGVEVPAPVEEPKAELLAAAVTEPDEPDVVDAVNVPDVVNVPNIPATAEAAQALTAVPTKPTKVILQSTAESIGRSVVLFMRSGLPDLIGGNATAVVICLYSHCGASERTVQKVGLAKIMAETGLSRQQVRDGLAVALQIRIAKRKRKGTSVGGVKLTAEYLMPWPTETLIRRWTMKAEALNAGLAPDELDGDGG